MPHTILEVRGKVKWEVGHWEGQWPVPSRDQPWALTGIDHGNAQGCQAVHTPALTQHSCVTRVILVTLSSS